VGFWLVTGGFLLAVVIVAWTMPTRPWIRWLLPFAALAVGVLLLTPKHSISLPIGVCYNGTDCRISGNAYRTLVGLSVPDADRLGYDGALALALGIAAGAAVFAFAVAFCRARFGRGGR
jgi:hypothetical protein